MSNFPYKKSISPIQLLGTQSVDNNAVYGTHFSTDGVGGYMEVYSLSDLLFTIPSGQTGSIEFSGNTIPINFIKGTNNIFSKDILILNSDNISSGRRKLGMLVYVYEEDQIYQFRIDNYETLWNNATGVTNTVVISEYGTTVNNSSPEGQTFINSWTANTIDGVSGETSLTAVWKKYSAGSGGTSVDTFVTGFTIVGNNLTLSQNRTDAFSAFTVTLPSGSGGTVSGDYLPLSGGTVSGNTIFTSGLTANTLNVTGNTFLENTSGTSFYTDYIDFNNNLTPLPADVEGRMYWDDDNGTVSLVMHGGQVVQQIGLEKYYYIKNQSGATIQNGRVVRAAGTLGASGRILGEYMIADGTIPPKFTLGVATEDIINGDDGFVTEFGLVRGINTTGSVYGETWTDGTILYVSSTISGGLTSVEPQPPNLKIEIAIVINAAANGSIFVRPNRYPYLYDLQQINYSAGTENNFDILQWSGNSWNKTNTPIFNGLTATTISATTYQNLPSFNFAQINGITQFSAGTNNNLNFSGVNINILSGTGNTLIFSAETSTGSTGTDIFITGGTYSSGTTTLELTNNTGGTISVSGFTPISSNWPVIDVTETTARLDDWIPSGWTGNNYEVKVININPNYTDKITMLSGLVGGVPGKIVTLHNSSATGLLLIENESVSSTTTNRFSMMQQSPFFLLPGRDVTFLYNGTRWSQFSNTHNLGGFDFLDDMSNGPQTAAASVITNLYQFVGSVAGTRVDDANSGEFGVLQLSTLTSASGTIIGAMGTRTNSAVFVSNSPSFPTVLLSKVKVPTVPSSTQDFRVDLGFIYTPTTSFTGPGVYWNLPTNATTTGFWQNIAINSTAVLNTTTNSVIPDTSTGWLYLGIYADGESPNINFIYFYSTDGVTYNVSSKFTRTTSAFGGKPFIRIGKTVGTTARTLLVDWSGISFNILR